MPKRPIAPFTVGRRGPVDRDQLAAADGPDGSRDAWTLGILMLAAFALLLTIPIVALGRARAATKSAPATTVAAPSVAAAAASGSSVAAPSVAATTAPAGTATVHLRDLAIDPKELSVAAGTTLEVVNSGAMPHSLAVKDSAMTTKMIDANGSDTLPLAGLAAGTYQLYCTVPGHEQAGMLATLHVTGGGTAAPAATGAATGAPAVTPGSAAKTPADATIDFSAKPAPGWKAFDPTLKPADGAAVHNVTFHATETVLEVAPGVKQQRWAFNDQVPGPVLRGNVGDVFNVTLVNDGKMGHSIDFHASKVSPDVQMRTLAPGKSLVYQFKANYAGAWMYHCGTAPALDHIGNGMYGAVVINPPGLPPVAHEYVMVQSELYLGPLGQPGNYTKMQAFKPDAVVFNGYANQYKFEPIKVQARGRVRVWVVDAGPSENSSFHVVGTIFDTVFKEGAYAVRPGTHGGAQTLDLQPAQGGFVEFTLDDAGHYPMVTHKFANVEKGALGLFQVGDGAVTASH